MMMLHAKLALVLATSFCVCQGATKGIVPLPKGKQAKKGKKAMKKTPAPTISASPTFSPTITPVPTASPSFSPTITPVPTVSPTLSPTTHVPTPHPTKKPTPQPTKKPTKTPTSSPTFSPTISPGPTPSPTALTSSPTRNPTKPPTKKPTRKPTAKPTKHPTSPPTFSPTITPIPTYSPTITPIPTFSPTGSPTGQKKAKAKKVMKGVRSFQTRAAGTTQSPTVSPTALTTTFTPTATSLPTNSPTTSATTLTPTSTFLPTIAPTQIRKGKKGKRGKKGKSAKVIKGVRELRKRQHQIVGKSSTQAPKGNTGKVGVPLSPPIGVSTKTTSKSATASRRRKKNVKSPPIPQGRVGTPSSTPVGAAVNKSSVAPKGSPKAGGVKGVGTPASTSPVSITSTIEFRPPGKKGPAQVIPYQPPGKKGGPIGKTAEVYSESPSSSPSQTPVTAVSKVPTAAASPDGLNPQFFAKVDVPMFSFNFSVAHTNANPSEQDYKDLSVITAVLLDGIFFDFFQGSNNTHYYSTDIASFTPISPFTVAFAASCYFQLPTQTPTPGQLAYLLNEKFNELIFVALLKRLAASNAFSTTSYVSLEIDQSILQSIKPSSSASAVASTSSSGAKVNEKIIAPVAAAALVAILAAAAMCLRSRRRSVADEEALNKKPPSEAHEDGTVDMDGSCYNSVVNRANRGNANGVATSTAEFGDTTADYDDCATQASGSYSMTPLPTIGESHDEIEPQGGRPRNVSSPCTTDEMSLSEVPLCEESDSEL